MGEFVNNILQNLNTFVYSHNIYMGLFFGILVIIIESIIPILPLAVFIAFNTVIFGNVLGFIISWVATIIGCTISFFIFRKGFSDKLYKKINYKETGKKLMNKISDFDFTKLVLILAIPFTPAFSINIAAGLSKMSYKKFLLALLISKLSTVYFWGFIGTTLLESITDVGVLVKLGIILLIAFILSRIVIKKFEIK